ncbi:hypothetical protein S40285_07008 [Stachybotrys chlorohalonatus IBT 40285]|uniref:Uncharacterized protein n=1 Tax=Stachybotrys chlorohalonatus (strain IBT 40285) TaxID=1283841 RepID=A0A084QYD3_STAC4|nr:hypothetical protein S40285_07008 [Stachybotrys chlorohalonata IBT 40285]
MVYTRKGNLPAIFNTQDENLHKQLKSPIASLYSLTNVVNFEKSIDEVMDILFEQLDKRFVSSRAVFDLADWLQYFAFEVMGTMTFSSRYGFLESGQDINGMLDAIWNFMLTVGPMTQSPWLDKILHKNDLAFMLTPHSGSPILQVTMDRVLERQRQRAIDSDSGKPVDKYSRDLLDRFLQLHAANPQLPPWSVTAWTFSNVIAGSDSTAVVMRTAIFHLLAHQESLQRLRSELLIEEQKGNISRPYPRWNEVKDLPYLDACVNEAVRLHPPFCLPLERVVPEGGVSICGQFFEEGTILGMNPYVVNRHKPTFGEDVEEWRPERWLGLSEDHRRKLEQAIMTFGAGRRVCLGKYVALLEIKKIIPALLLNYEFDLVDPKAYEVENSYFFRQKGINVRVASRSSGI